MFLNADQIAALTGYRQRRRQITALQRMGIRHWVRLDGRPVVAESALEKPQHSADGPNWEAINATE
jgi:hypothetical protein